MSLATHQRRHTLNRTDSQSPPWAALPGIWSLWALLWPVDDEFEGDLADQSDKPVDADTEITIRVSDEGFAFDWCYGHDPKNAVWQAAPE